jgi:hypothetical protein
MPYMNLSMDQLGDPLNPAQLRLGEILPSNFTRVDSSGSLMTQTANLDTVLFGPGPGPEVTMQNCC